MAYNKNTIRNRGAAADRKARYGSGAGGGTVKYAHVEFALRFTLTANGTVIKAGD